jgi:DNA-binding NtrC family response regulator
VRELRNYLERCLALREQMPIDESPSDAAPAIDVRQTLRSAREACVRAFEHRYLAALLRAHDNNVSAAARAADIDRPYLYRLLARHQLR